MPGPLPKPASQRQRRNATVGMTQLPMEGYQGEVPEWPLERVTQAEAERWYRVWGSPMAVLWARMGEPTWLTVARYVRASLIVEEEHRASVSSAHLAAEVRQLEDRLGISPLAMLRLRWEITPDEIADQREERKSRGKSLRAFDSHEESG